MGVNIPYCTICTVSSYRNHCKLLCIMVEKKVTSCFFHDDLDICTRSSCRDIWSSRCRHCSWTIRESRCCPCEICLTSACSLSNSTTSWLSRESTIGSQCFKTRSTRRICYTSCILSIASIVIGSVWSKS